MISKGDTAILLSFIALSMFGLATFATIDTQGIPSKDAIRNYDRDLRGKTAKEKQSHDQISIYQDIPSPDDQKANEESANSFTRIINGFTASKPYKHFVFLLEDDKPSGCGGVLIHKRYVLTAAHCVQNNSVNKVYINAYAPWETDNGGYPFQMKGVSNTYIHRDYNERTISNDFAVLKLVSRVDNVFIPVKLPRAGRTYASGERFTVMGFGKVSDDILHAETLQVATVNYVPNDLCPLSQVKGQDSMLCALGNKTDSCNGDSGGPLISETNGCTELVGLVSWGIGCAVEGVPGVYSRVQSGLPWIYETICVAGTSAATSGFCINGIADFPPARIEPDAFQATKSCTSISGKFKYNDSKNGKKKSQKCNWKDIGQYCTSTVQVDGVNMPLVEACPSECSAAWCV